MITIFEGCDCSGKSTAAKSYARKVGAEYVHFGAVSDRKLIAEIYIDKMLPAILHDDHVVMDRSWLSELPYGIAFRGGSDRLGYEATKNLTLLASTLNGVVVYCRPQYSSVLQEFNSRRDTEMLDNDDQLRVVYDEYDKCMSNASKIIPTMVYDYNVESNESLFKAIDSARIIKPYKQPMAKSVDIESAIFAVYASQLRNTRI